MTSGEKQSSQREAPEAEHGGWVASAGEILEAVVADSDEEVGSSVGSDEPAEYGYDYALADERAVKALERVLEEEGFELNTDFAPRRAQT